MKVVVNLNIDQKSAKELIRALEILDLDTPSYFKGLKQQVSEGMKSALYLLDEPLPKNKVIHIELILNYMLVETSTKKEAIL